jgi:hypothetical protein
VPIAADGRRHVLEDVERQLPGRSRSFEEVVL